MLTINADEHPVMQRFHKPGDEKRSVVVLDDKDWMAWMKADREEDVRAFLRLFDTGMMRAEADPKALAAEKTAIRIL
jgi:hypothetical protein